MICGPPTTGDRKPTVFLKTKFRERQPVCSADGRWIAYSSNSSGREEVYIRPFPRGEAVHSVSRAGGWAPRWLFPTDFRPENNRPYDVTRDGTRFLIPTIRPSDDYRVVLNWRSLLPKGGVRQ